MRPIDEQCAGGRDGGADRRRLGGYEQLKRVAQRAGDIETAQTAERILAQERLAAERIFARFGPTMDLTLGALNVTA